MTQPRPTISSPNKYDAYFRQTREFASRFAALEGVVGVLLTSGLARGCADRFFELNLAAYLTRPHFEAWTRRGEAPFPESDFCLDGWHVDFLDWDRSLLGALVKAEPFQCQPNS